MLEVGKEEEEMREEDVKEVVEEKGVEEDD